MATKSMTERPIRAVFYSDYQARNPIKLNRGKHPESMCLLAHKHLRFDHYGAVLVEVFNEDTGKLHAVLKVKLNGMGIEAVYEAKPNPEDR